jgi:hypothetical protein
MRTLPGLLPKLVRSTDVAAATACATRNHCALLTIVGRLGARALYDTKNDKCVHRTNRPTIAENSHQATNGE